MKKKCLIFTASVGLVALMLQAQTHMTVWKKDGSTVNYQITEVDSITFSNLMATLTKHGGGSSSQTVDQYSAITSYYYNWTNATGVIVTGLPTGVTAEIDETNSKVTISGTPTVSGTFAYTITTTGDYTNTTVSGTITVNAVTKSQTLELTAKQLAAKMYLGCNIGNTLESTGCSTTSSNETCWGSPKITQSMIDAYKAAGFNAIRLPVAWNIYASANNGVIPDWWISRVKEVVDYCINDGLYVLLNIHWDNGWLEGNVNTSSQTSVNATQANLWKQIATYFKDYDEHLVFCSTNEPSVESTEEATVLKSYHQTFVNTVRATGGYNGTRCLVVQCASTDADKAITYDIMPTDEVKDRLMMEFHYYPYSYCLMEYDASWSPVHWFWGKDYQNITIDGVNRSCSWNTEEYVSDQFSQIKSKYVDNGIPVILGEFACCMERTVPSDYQAKYEASRAYYYEYIVKTAKNNGIVPFLWDIYNTENSLMVIDRANNKVNNTTEMNGLLKGAQEGSYPF